MEVSRNFLATFAPFEIDTLPAACQPGRVRTAAEVMAYASRLLQHRCDDGVGTEYAVHRLAAFFSMASARVEELRLEARPSAHQASA